MDWGALFGMFIVGIWGYWLGRRDRKRRSPFSATDPWGE